MSHTELQNIINIKKSVPPVFPEQGEHTVKSNGTWEKQINKTKNSYGGIQKSIVAMIFIRTTIKNVKKTARRSICNIPSRLFI
jgi:hypothetical protein